MAHIFVFLSMALKFGNILMFLLYIQLGRSPKISVHEGDFVDLVIDPNVPIQAVIPVSDRTNRSGRRINYY